MAEQDNPIRKSEQKSIRPDFLKNNKSEPVDGLKEADKKASSSVGENNVAGGLGKTENSSGGLWKGKGLLDDKKKSGKGKGKSKMKKVAPLATVALLLIFGVIIIIPSIPMLVIGAIDFNLQESLGFSGTSAVLEKVGEHVTAEMAANGEFPSGLAGDFAKSGLLVGQVTESGDFVRTNSYVADIDDTLEVAATGIDYHRYGSEGELAILYNGRVIKADEFVAAVESDPVLYADYSEALDITARFYYSEDVDEIYEELDLARDSFSDWESSGNHEEDMEVYYEKLQEVLGGDKVKATMGGCAGKDCDSAKFDAKSATSGATRAAGRGDDSTGRASQLLNMAISSTEPQQAAKAFMAIEEPIQRARLDGTGPINETMTMLNRSVYVSYVDVNTKQCIPQNKSILETTNFVAAVSGGGYSQEEANNFSRDRALVAADTIDDDNIGGVIQDSTLGDEDATAKDAVLTKGNGGAAVDRDAIAQVKGSVNLATSDFTIDSLTSIVGGNRAISGGSYLSNTINQKALGGMASDEAAIANYQHEVDTVLARKANAERATLSPFDISSPNTFLGSIANSFATAYVKNSSFGEGGLVSAVGAIANTAKASADNLTGTATADGNGQTYATIKGNCATVKQAANVEGDIYCNAHNTLSTKFIDRTKEQWGDMENDEGFKEFTIYGMDREATVGVKSKMVCESYYNAHSNLFGDIKRFFAGLIGAYEACDGIDENIANGSAYALSGSNVDNGSVEEYSGFALYNTVYSLMSEKQSAVSKIREEYYAKYPKDNSPAGRIARYSGMSKAEAEIALGYASYLAMVNNYDASTRFAFGGFRIEQPLTIVDDAEIKETIYGFWQGKMEFADLRNRNQVA